jgi:hypothetical protein
MESRKYTNRRKQTLDSLQTDQLHNCGSILLFGTSTRLSQIPFASSVARDSTAQPIETENLAVAQAPIWGLVEW